MKQLALSHGYLLKRTRWEPTMREPWHSILAESPETDLDPFPSSAQLAVAAHEGGLLAPLPEIGVLHVAGDDASAFLHNQLTQSITDIQAHETRLAAWCNPKGRTRALVRVVPSDTGLLLIANAEVLEAIQPTLQMFIFRSRVALTSLSDREGLMGMAGPVAANLLTETVGTLPATAGHLLRAGDLHVIALASESTQRYLVLAPADQLSALWQRYKTALSRADSQFWQLLNIQAGLPEVSLQTQEMFIPTMLNLEPLGGIHYEKGCYPGQEVVARMHYLGKLKRRMYRAAIAAEPPAPGTAVNDSTGAEAGQVVTAAPASDNGSELLVVCRIEKAAQDTLNIDGHALEFLDLPYPPPGDSG
jgi:folate-binding protein YgfZ